MKTRVLSFIKHIFTKSNAILLLFAQMCVISLFFSSIFINNAALISGTVYDSYQVSTIIKKNTGEAALSVYSKDNKSDIIWRNSGYVGYELGYRYETNNSKAFFIANMVESSCSYWFDDYQIESIQKTISASELAHLYKNKYSGDYLGLKCDAVLNDVKNYWELYDSKEYCYITPITADCITDNNELANRNDLVGQNITVKKKNGEAKNLIIAGILSESSFYSYYSVYGDFVLSHQSNIVYDLDSYGISIKYSKPDTQGIGKQLMYIDVILKDSSNYSYFIDVDCDTSLSFSRNISYNNKLYFLPAVILFAGVFLLLFIFKNRISYSYKKMLIVFLFSSLFWLILFQLISIPTFSVWHIVLDSYSVFFIYSLMACSLCVFARFINKKKSPGISEGNTYFELNI